MNAEPRNTPEFHQEHPGTHLLLSEQIRRGGGLLFVDSTADTNLLKEIQQHAARYGREHDVLVINPGDPSRSNSYNPILYGSPDEVASRILSIIPSTESNAGADFYRQSNLQGLVMLIGALQRAGLAYHFMDLSILFTNPCALSDLERMVAAAAPESNEARNLSVFLGQFRVPAESGMIAPLDVNRMKTLFGGLGGRLFVLGSGHFGKVMNTYDPEINLFEGIRHNKIIYCVPPTMGKAESARAFGKVLAGDLRAALARLRAITTSESVWPDFSCFFDDHLFPNEMKTLGKCECLGAIGGDTLYSVWAPFIDPAGKTDSKPGEPQAGREYPTYTNGSDFFKNAARYLTDSDLDE